MAAFLRPGVREVASRLVPCSAWRAASLSWVAGEYTIAGGLADARRLARQAHVMEAATVA